MDIFVHLFVLLGVLLFVSVFIWCHVYLLLCCDVLRRMSFVSLFVFLTLYFSINTRVIFIILSPFPSTSALILSIFVLFLCSFCVVFFVVFVLFLCRFSLDFFFPVALFYDLFLVQLLNFHARKVSVIVVTFSVFAFHSFCFSGEVWSRYIFAGDNYCVCFFPWL